MFDANRRRQIQETAIALWTDFIEYRRPANADPDDYRIAVARELLSPADLQAFRRRTSVIRDFFQFCAELFAPSADDFGATAAIAVRASIVPMDLARLSKIPNRRPASWLMSLGDNKRLISPTILIDRSCLLQNLSVHAALRAFAHLALHEVGHLVLHWEKLRPTTSATHLADSAQPEQEAEAWWFCYCLLGYVVAVVAEANKQDGQNPDDQMWLNWMR